MRISNELQNSEIQDFQAFAIQHGIVLDGEQGVRNGEVLGGFIIAQDKMISPETLQEAFSNEQVRGQLVIKSVTEREFDSAFSQFAPPAQEAFSAWFRKQKQLICEGQEGFSNAAQVLNWLRGKPVNNESCNRAMSNLANSSRHPLFWTAAPVETRWTPYRDKKFESDKQNSENRDYVNGRKNHARSNNPALQSEVPKKVRDEEYKSRAELVQGATHSATQAIRRCFIIEKGNINWAATYQARLRMAEGHKETV